MKTEAMDTLGSVVQSVICSLCYIAALLSSSNVLVTFSGCLLSLLLFVTLCMPKCFALSLHIIQSDIERCPGFPGFLWDFHFQVPKGYLRIQYQSAVVRSFPFVAEQLIEEPLKCWGFFQYLPVVSNPFIHSIIFSRGLHTSL